MGSLALRLARQAGGCWPEHTTGRAPMWSVIRKRQGLPYIPQEPTTGDASFAKNNAHLVAHEVKPFPTPMDDAAVTLGYGNRSMPRMTGLLSDPRVVVRVRTLDLLVTLLAEP